MRDIQPNETYDDPRRQRRLVLNGILAIVAAILLLGWGWLQRNNALNATIPYEDDTSGIRAQIPANWLLSRNPDDAVFRVENPDTRPYKTTIQVTVQTVGEDAISRNIVDLLKLQGPQTLSGYVALSEESVQLGEDDATRINYAFIDVELNPFLESAPVVVRGEDVVVLRGNQAIIITYRDAEENFERNRFYFENFLATLEY